MTLLNNQSTRLKFSIYVIIINFLFGLAGIWFKVDLVALGTFLSMSNAPLYVYVLGRTIRGETVVKDENISN